MKKIVLILLVNMLLFSCSSHPGRVCGGAGGKRCVDTSVKKVIVINSKANV